MDTYEIAFAIQGMGAAGANCAVLIERALTRRDGVIAAHVNYATERAWVKFDPARVTAQQIVNIVNQPGFTVVTQRATRALSSIWRGDPIPGFARHALVNARPDWRAQTLQIEWLADAANETVPRALIVELIARGVWQRSVRVPILVGVLAAAAMFALYILILTAFQDFAHAWQQARQDAIWVGLVSFGFGAQIGLYTRLRLLVRAANAIGATAATGAGTTTATLGMVACCAHHLTDLAPLVAIAGATSLSGAIEFLSGWKIAFILSGLVVNAFGVLITIRTMHQSRARAVMETVSV